MAIQTLPAQIAGVIEQVGFLEQIIREPLMNECNYDAAAEREPIPTKIGETITKSRQGLKAPKTTPANPETLGDLNNGMTASFPTYEQYQITVGKWHDTIDLDLESEQTLIARQFIINAEENARQAGTSMDILSAVAYHTAYDAGSTFVTVVTDTTHISVDNIIGFDMVYKATAPTNSPGLPVQTSSTYHQTANVYRIVSSVKTLITTCVVDTATADGTNTSTAGIYGASGSFVLHAAPGAAILAGDLIQATDGAFIIRPNGRLTRNDLVAGDTISLSHFAQAKGKLKARQVKPLKNGLYGCIVDPLIMSQLYDDPRFITATQGTWDVNPVFQQGVIAKGIGLEFVDASTIPNYTIPSGAGLARHAAVMGEGAIVKGPFTGTFEAAKHAAAGLSVSDIKFVNDVKFTTRPALDKEGNFVSQSWSWTGGRCAPTDVTSNAATIPTSDSSRNKRGVVIECFSAQ